jgi:nicotinamidase-related amidase
MNTKQVLRRALIIVDMSVEQMAAVSYHAKTVSNNCRKLILRSSSFFDLKIDSRLWLTSPDESSLAKVWPETAKTMFVADSEGASLIPELREELENDNLVFCKKYNYSCFSKPSELLSLLQKENISEVYICGINTDYCVFATAMDAFQNNFETYVISDAVSSVRGRQAHEEGLRNLERHFGDNVLVTCDEILQRSSSSS